MKTTLTFILLLMSGLAHSEGLREKWINNCNEDRECLIRVAAFVEWWKMTPPENRFYIPRQTGFVCRSRESAAYLYNVFISGYEPSWSNIHNQGCDTTRTGAIVLRPISIEDNNVITVVDYSPVHGGSLLRGYTVHSFIENIPMPVN